MKKLLFPILAVFMLSSTTFAGDGNGGGANGPDLKGKAIPVTLDREIEIDELTKKSQQCGVDFNRALIAQAFGIKLPNPEIHEAYVVSPYYTDASYLSSFASKKRPRDMSEVFYKGVTLGVDRSGQSIVTIYKDFANSGSTLIPREGNFEFPYLKFDTVVVDTSYDEWGNIMDYKKVARNFRLINGGQGIVKLKNQATGRDVAFQVDFRPYEACLVQSVQQ